MSTSRLIAVGFCALVFIPVSASAHNAGHLFLPDGTCHEVGSFRDAPLVGQDRTQLDLVPETPNPPFDEYGVSFAGLLQVGVLFPGPCRPPQAVQMNDDADAFPSFAEIGGI